MKLLITRPIPDAYQTEATCKSYGHDSLLAPLMTITPHADGINHLNKALRNDPQAILVTSINAARQLIPISDQVDIPVYCSGDAASNTLHEAGIDAISAGKDSAALVSLVVSSCQPQQGSLLYVSGEHISHDLTLSLSPHGFNVKRIIGYEAKAATTLPKEVIIAIEQQIITGILFYSKRTASIFCDLATHYGLIDSLSSIHAYCLSDAIAETLNKCPFASVKIAPRPDEDSLLALFL